MKRNFDFRPNADWTEQADEIAGLIRAAALLGEPVQIETIEREGIFGPGNVAKYKKWFVSVNIGEVKVEDDA